MHKIGQTRMAELGAVDMVYLSGALCILRAHLTWDVVVKGAMVATLVFEVPASGPKRTRVREFLQMSIALRLVEVVFARRCVAAHGQNAVCIL